MWLSYITGCKVCMGESFTDFFLNSGIVVNTVDYDNYSVDLKAIYHLNLKLQIQRYV